MGDELKQQAGNTPPVFVWKQVRSSMVCCRVKYAIVLSYVAAVPHMEVLSIDVMHLAEMSSGMQNYQFGDCEWLKMKCKVGCLCIQKM